MNAYTLIQEAKAAGVTFSMAEDGTLKTGGTKESIRQWLPKIREHKAAIVELLAANDEPRRWWCLHFADLPTTITVCSVPGSTFAEIMASYPTAIAAEPFESVTETPDTVLTASDEQVIRDWLTKIGETDKAVIDSTMTNCRTDQNARAYFLRRAAEAEIAEREFFEERAAIIEYDGGLPRDEAERRALDEILRRRSS